MPSLEHEIAQLHHGDHLCMPYSSLEQQLPPLAAFARDGWERGERFLFVGQAAKLESLLEELQRRGLDTDRLRQRRALVTMLPAALYRATGRFDIALVLDALERQVAAAIRDGFTGLRGASDVENLPSGPAALDAIVEYETQLDKQFRRQPMVAMCQFDQRSVPAGALCRVLCAHPRAMAAEHVCKNPYYEPAMILDERDRDGMRLEWMLRQLERGHRQETRQADYAESLASQAASLTLEAAQRRRSEDELARLLQARDAFMSMASQAMGSALATVREELAIHLSATPDTSARVQAQLGFLESIAEQMHEVGGLPGRRATSPQPLDLAEVVRTCANRQVDDLADAGCALTVQTDRPVPGRWDRTRVEQLMDSLLARAGRCARGHAVHVLVQPDDCGRAHIVVSTAPDAGSTRSVRRDSDAVAAQAHEQRYGATVWIARAMAESMNGALTASGAPAGGEQIVVELPSLPAPRAR